MTTTSAALSPYDKIRKGEFTALLPRESKEPALELLYGPLPIRSANSLNEQRRHEGRYALMPEVDIKDYTCKAVVDYVVLEFAPHEHLGFSEIREKFKNTSPRGVWLDGNDQETGRHRYTIRVQEPNLKEIAKLVGEPPRPSSLAGIMKTFTGFSEMKVREVEISLDFKPNNGSENERQLMVGLLTRHYLPPATMMAEKNDAIRVVKKQGGRIRNRPADHVRRLDQVFPDLDDIDTPIERDALEEEIRVDHTMYVGKSTAEARIRVMEKITDRRDPKTGKADGLPEDKKRARIEVTLKGDALNYDGSLSNSYDVTTFESLLKFKFQKLSHHFFQFRLATLPTLTNQMTSMDVAAAQHEAPLLDIFLKMGIANYQREQLRFGNIVHNEGKMADRKIGPITVPVTKSRVGSGHNTNMIAYRELNAKVNDALRRLTARVASKGV